jgi:hypothetical protein
MKHLDKNKLTEHLTICIEISEGKKDIKVAEVLRNLNQDVEEGTFDSDDAET